MRPPADPPASPPTAPEAELPDAFEDLHRRRRRRVLTVVAVLVAIAAAIWFFNRAPDRGEVVDCGDLDTRPADAAPLPHDRYCRLRGTVETTLLLSMGPVDARAPTEAGKRKKLRYFVKLRGAPVIAALSGADPAVEAWRARADHLQGFRVEGVGRVFDPAQEKGYGGMGASLRQQFAVDGDAPLRVFDTEDRPAKTP